MHRSGYLLLLPIIAALAVVEVYPLAYSAYLSVSDYSTGQFVGLSNYALVFSQQQFFGTGSSYLAVTLGAISVTLFYALGSTVLTVGIGLLLAFQVSQLTKRRWLFESLFLAPLAVAPLVAGVAWAPSGMWDDFNAFWHFALGQPFFNPAASGFFYPVMIFTEAWEWAPLIMLISLGIMGSQPKEVYEAASLHGASAWQVFRRVSLPTILKSPVMGFIVVIRFIDAARAFEIPFSWSTWVSYPQAGSPVDTLSLLLFKLLTGYSYSFPVGYVSSVAIILLAITLAGATVLLRLMNRTTRI